MKIKSYVMAVLVVLIVLGGVFTSMALGIWSTKNANSSFREDSGQSEQLIKGKTTFNDILGLGITPQQIETILGAAMPPGTQTVKDYCAVNGLSFSAVKEQLLELIE